MLARRWKEFRIMTVWAACRAVIFGCIIIVVGLAMTVLGYFDKYFSEKTEIIDGTEQVTHDRMIQYQLKSMQYLGPILMGIGSFILIIACVVTLESRDKHAQIITEESILQKRRRLISEEEEKAEHNDVFIQDDDEDKEPYFGGGRRFVTLDANRLAPLADVDSLTDISLTHRGGSESRLQSEDVTVPPDSTEFYQECELQDLDENEPTTSSSFLNPTTTFEDLQDDVVVDADVVAPSEVNVTSSDSPKSHKLRLEVLASEMD
ncbi:Protein CBG24559 [Caenorhabditis briggsae]|uniref:Protein CBG24559 n=2 Tax=Caenorhabditis briggsae TaxID=6238 RepID=A8WKZ1_CAEBR|nr:Protein CBG24559 [Caenorhabditis briggsae]CAP21137.2 Protein CBG24559 [Caenorhabditis briggsae]